MNPSKVLVAAALAAASHLAVAQPDAASTRTVSLKNKQGKVTDVQVGDEVRNFDQLRVGDTVTAEYKEALSVNLSKQSGMRSSTERAIEERSAPGAKPGGVVGREVTVTADVVAVNTKTGKVTLKGPKGKMVDLHVEDPQQLKGIRKGDQVQAVYTEALAVSVTPKGGH